MLEGGGIRAFRFADTPGTFQNALVDNIDLQTSAVPQVPLPSMLVLVMGLIGVGAAQAWSRR